VVQGLLYFVEHQAKEYNEDNIEFWQIAEKYFRAYCNCDDTEVVIPQDKQLDDLAAQHMPAVSQRLCMPMLSVCGGTFRSSHCRRQRVR
jgi:hypothetical protein